MEQKNWINITRSPSLYCRYAYFDLEDHLADSLFERENVAVKYEQEFVNPVNNYRLVICRVLPWHRDGFLKALDEPAGFQRLPAVLPGLPGLFRKLDDGQAADRLK